LKKFFGAISPKESMGDPIVTDLGLKNVASAKMHMVLDFNWVAWILAKEQSQ